MKRIISALTLWLSLTVMVFAQGGYQVKGVVLDSQGPVIGATVMEQGQRVQLQEGL